MNWEIIPFLGVGRFCFGMSRTDVRLDAGAGNEPFRKGCDAERDTDAWDQLGMHCYYDENDCLECIELFEPNPVSFAGVALAGRETAIVLEELEEQGLDAREIDVGYEFDEQGFALYAPRSIVEGVTVFRRGYYDKFNAGQEE